MSLRFSVITPSFCQGSFIERTIESVLSQNIEDMEYIICDGGSDDETIEILKKYGEKVRWLSEKDQGQADAVNKGILMTTGDIIAWINSDDIYYPTTFQVVKDIFAQYPEIELIYGDADHIDEYDHMIEPYPTKPWNYQNLLETCYICQPAVFFKRSLIEKFGLLDISLNYCMDYELWLRYGKHISFHYLPKKLAASRLYPTNKTLSQRVYVYKEIIQMLYHKFGFVSHKWVLGYIRIEIDNFLKNDHHICINNIVKTLLVVLIQIRRHIPSQPISNLILLIIKSKKYIK